MTSIEAWAFEGCSSLTSVIANMTTPFTFGTDAFSGIGSTCWLKTPLGTKYAYIDKGWTKDVFQGGVYDGGEGDTFTYKYSGKTLTYKVTDAKNRFVQVGTGNKGENGNAIMSNEASGTVSIPSSAKHPILETAYTVTGIGEYAFTGRKELTSINIPATVTHIETYALGMTGITSLTIPSSVNYIYYTAFMGCKDLASITVASGNTTYDSRDNCNGIIYTATNNLAHACKNTTIPEGVEMIGCYLELDVPHVILPSTLKKIDDWAFSYCTNIQKVTAKMTTPFVFDNGAFSNISPHCKLEVPIGTKAAYIAAGWTEEVFQGGVYEIDTFTYTYNNWKLTYSITDATNRYVQVGTGRNAVISTSANGTMSIPNSVTHPAFGTSYTVKTIGNYAFYACGDLKSVNIPNSVTSIGDYAFHQCWNLTSVTIPNSVTSIGSYAFSICSLTSVNIPNSVTSIGEGAFFNSSGLQSVSIPNSVTSIEEETFKGCSGLTSVTIPSSVTSIGESAFSGCRSLTSVTANMTSPFTFGAYAFYNISETCKLYVPTGKKAAYIAAGWTEEVFKGGVFEIGSAAVTGDVDGSGTPDISDVTLLVNMILGKADKNSAADVNKDGDVNISDVTTLVNIILGK